MSNYYRPKIKEEDKVYMGYDIEIFKDFVSLVFIKVDKPDEVYEFIIKHGYKNDLQALKYFINSYGCRLVLIGYNNLHFDNIILNALLKAKDVPDLANHIHWLAQKIITKPRFEKPHPKVTELKYDKTVKYSSIDVMTIMAFDKLGVTLKHAAILLKWRLIKDLPLDPNANVPMDKIEEILLYNINDVLITIELYKAILGRITLREQIGELFGVDVINASDSRMANILLNKIYSEESGIHIKDLKELRTYRPYVDLIDVIPNTIKFKTNKLNDLLDKIKAKIVYEDEYFKFKEDVTINGVTFDVGVGGLHSRDEPGVFEKRENFIIIDADVASFYPNIMINHNITPEHLGEQFIPILKKLTKERLEAKPKPWLNYKGNKIKADGLKIVINSIFGKLGSKTYWLYDPKAMLSVTVSGQLYLLMLIERLTLAGFDVISANTDGIVTTMHPDNYDNYVGVCKKWEEDTNFELEFTEYQKYVRRDVNNYVTIKTDGSTKTKGVFEYSINLLAPNPSLGYIHPIVSEAIYNYYVNGIPVKNTIETCVDKHKFLITQKVAKKFKTIAVSIKNNQEHIEELQKTNRYYVSTNGVYLYKFDPDTFSKNSLVAGEYVTVTNEIEDFDFNNIKYQYYISEANKIIQQISGNAQQLKLF